MACCDSLHYDALQSVCVCVRTTWGSVRGTTVSAVPVTRRELGVLCGSVLGFWGRREMASFLSSGLA